jgi:hypothetical protein
MTARIARCRKEEKPTHGGLDRMRDGDVGKLKHKVHQDVAPQRLSLGSLFFINSMRRSLQQG